MIRTVAVLVIDASGSERLDDLLELVTRSAGWSARGSIIVWQVVPGDAPARATIGGGAGGGCVRIAGRDVLQELTESMSLEPGGRYFVSPRQSLRFDGRKARLEAAEPDLSRAIDRLLLSLAESWGEHSICLLEFAGAEGASCGARIVRSVGGLVLSPPGPRAKPLPRPVPPLAARGGLVEVPSPRGTSPLAVAEARLAEASATEASATEASAADDGAADAAAAEGPCSGVRAARTRPESAPRSLRVFTLPAKDVKTARQACRAAVERGLASGRVRVWMPACGTGGVTYAIAMLTAQAARQLAHPPAPPPKMVLFGTDEDGDALSMASAGRYRAGDALGMDPELRATYTLDEGDVIRVSETLRAQCVFSRHDLLREPPLTRIDLVVCHRVFEGVPVARREQLLDSLQFSIREGGVLLALDPLEHFPERLFERVDGGFLRARAPARRSAPIATPSSSASSRPPLAPRPAARAGAQAEIALPLVVCDAELRVSFISRVAMAELKLLPADVGEPLRALVGRVPGGAELLHSVRRVSQQRRAEELSVRCRGRAYLARVSVAEPGGAVTVAYIDVTRLELARARAVAEQHRQTALARIGQLGAGLATAAPLYDEALSALFGNIHACSAGVIVELAGSPLRYQVAASRGLGAEPLRTLRGMDAVPLLDQAVARDCIVSQHGARVPLEGPEVASRLRSARARQAVSTLAAGLACPISSEGSVIGVIGLFGRHAGLDSREHRGFAKAVTRLLGAAVMRHRVHRGLALELGVRRQLTGAVDGKGLAEGITRVFESALQADRVELWSSCDERRTHWRRLFPLPGDQHPARVAVASSIGPAPVLRSGEGGQGELLIPLAASAPPRYLLRVRAAALGSIDGELIQSSRRIGAMLGAFLEQSIHPLWPA